MSWESLRMDEFEWIFEVDRKTYEVWSFEWVWKRVKNSVFLSGVKMSKCQNVKMSKSQICMGKWEKWLFWESAILGDFRGFWWFWVFGGFWCFWGFQWIQWIQWVWMNEWVWIIEWVWSNVMSWVMMIVEWVWEKFCERKYFCVWEYFCERKYFCVSDVSEEKFCVSEEKFCEWWWVQVLPWWW